MEHINQRIAHRVSGELAGQRRSQRWLSEATGIPLTTLTRKLRGQRPFNVVELTDVSSVLGVELVNLIESTPSTHKQAA